MPELPEVETVKRDLEQQGLVGCTFTDVTVSWARTVDTIPVDEFRQSLIGQEIKELERRGKYLILSLSQYYLLIHLRMTGRLFLLPQGREAHKHTRAVLALDDGRSLYFRDMRKFGRFYLVTDVQEVVGHLGPEPLASDFTVDAFEKCLEGRTGRVKSLLLNQQFLAGLGNIYADEVLYRAGVHPLRSADSLTGGEVQGLHGAIRTTLQDALRDGGTSFSDFRSASGEKGRHQEQLCVFQRDGNPCAKCGTVIERIVVGGRSTHYCPRCQG